MVRRRTIEHDPVPELPDVLSRVVPILPTDAKPPTADWTDEEVIDMNAAICHATLLNISEAWKGVQSISDVGYLARLTFEALERRTDLLNRQRRAKTESDSSRKPMFPL